MNARNLLLIAILAASPCLWGCRKDTDVPDEPRAPATSEEVRKKAGEALESAGEYLGKKKDEFVAFVSTELGQLEERFEEVRKKRAGAADQGGEKLSDLQSKVSEKLAVAKEKLGDLKKAGSQAWEDTARECDRAMTELRAAYEDFIRANKSEP